MAIYHCSVKIISRSSGRSSVGASAYRSAQKLYNQHDGITHDYTRKKGVVYNEIILCESAPIEYSKREQLWNAVEKIEKSSNAQLSREVEIALPIELSIKEQILLVQEYVKDNFVSIGMCADVAIHDKKDGNPHAHIMLTMRSIDEVGKWKSKSKKIYIMDGQGNKIYDKKTRQYKCFKQETNNWNDKTNIEKWREDLAEKINASLLKKNIEQEVTHKSFERQGIEKQPTIHLGSSAHQMEQRGIETERGTHNKRVVAFNSELEKTNNLLLDVEKDIKLTREDIEQVKLKIFFPATKNEIIEKSLNNPNVEIVNIASSLVYAEQEQEYFTRVPYQKNYIYFNKIDVFKYDSEKAIGVMIAKEKTYRLFNEGKKETGLIKGEELLKLYTFTLDKKQTIKEQDKLLYSMNKVGRKSNLQEMANTLLFIRKENIQSYTEIEKKIQSLSARANEIQKGQLNPLEEKKQELGAIIYNLEIYNKYRSLRDKEKNTQQNTSVEYKSFSYAAKELQKKGVLLNTDIQLLYNAMVDVDTSIEKVRATFNLARQSAQEFVKAKAMIDRDNTVEQSIKLKTKRQQNK